MYIKCNVKLLSFDEKDSLAKLQQKKRTVRPEKTREKVNKSQILNILSSALLAMQFLYYITKSFLFLPCALKVLLLSYLHYIYLYCYCYCLDGIFYGLQFTDLILIFNNVYEHSTLFQTSKQQQNCGSGSTERKQYKT